MRYFWTIFWAFLLSQMLVYVISSMQGFAFSFTNGVLLTVIFSIAVIFLGDAGIPDESK
jgi:hypothetical protein